jgi:hypothetical protein
MKPHLIVPVACVALSSLLLVPDVFAQFGGGMGGGGMGGMGAPRQGERGKGCGSGEKPDASKGPMGQQPEMMGREQLEYRLNTLQVDLRLTPEQAALWQTFSDRVLALEGDLARQRSRTAPVNASTLSAPGSPIKPIAAAVDQTRNRLTALEDIEAASRTLYQALQADQKTMADVRMAEFLTPLLRT